MIKIARKIYRGIISIIDWPEVFNGLLFFLVGAAFVRHYGYRVNWQSFLDLSLWFIFYKSAIYCLSALLSGKVDQNEEFNKIIRNNKGDMRILLYKYFWIVTITFLAVSCIPFFQLFNDNRVNGLSLAIMTLICLSDLVFLITDLQSLLSGIIEVKYAFVTAFLLPALFFSLSRDYIKEPMILVIFPLFLQLIAWQIVNHLECTRRKEPIPLTSIIQRIGAADSIAAASILVFLGTLTIFLDLRLVRLVLKMALVPIGVLTAWFILRSGRNQKMFWQRALFFTRIMPLFTAVTIIYSIWVN